MQTPSPPVRVVRRPSLGVILLGLAVAWQLVLAAQPYSFLSYQVLAADDAYYYFKIVRNFVRLGWVTFDGLHATSGVQLLWSVVLVPLAWAIEDRMLLVRAVLVLCAGLNLCTGLALRRLAIRLTTPLVGDCVAVMWAVVLLVWLTPTLTGMEYALHAAIIAWTLLAWWPIVRAPHTATRGAIAMLALALTLNFWTRLDSALYSAALGAVAACRLLWVGGPAGRRVGSLAWLLGVPALGAAAYGVTCYVIAGTVTPISGTVKSVYAGLYFAGVPSATVWRERVEWWMQIQAQSVVDLVATPFGIAAWGQREKLACLAVGLAMAAWGAWRAWRRGDARTREFSALIAGLLALGGVHVAVVIATIAHFSYVTRHYYAWTQIAWCLWFGYVLAQALEALAPRARRVVAGAVTVAVVVAQVVAVVPRFEPFSPKELRHGRLLAVEWADQHLPPGAPIGAWNAGQVGYFMDRPVVNLDGLVNDRRYLDVLRGRERLIDYLHAEGIEYVMDYNQNDLSMPYHATWKHDVLFRNALSWDDLTVIHSQPAGNTEVQLLQIRPAARHAPGVALGR